jgi:predicted transcriptional regulator
MADTKLGILHDIFIRTRNGGFITMREIEVNTALSGSRLRPILEDLKEEGLVIEYTEGLFIAPGGMHFCRSRWD